MRITVHTDGSYRHGLRLGGWGAVVRIGSTVYELGGSEWCQSSNNMEMLAIIRALQNIPFRIQGSIVVYTDSKYVIGGVTDKAWKWMHSRWRRTNGKFIRNMKMWKVLLDLVRRHTLNKKMHWVYIKSHSGNPGNERADYIAGTFSGNYRMRLYVGEADNYTIPL